MIWIFLLLISLLTLGIYGIAGTMLSFVTYCFLKLTHKKPEKKEKKSEENPFVDIRRIKVKSLNDTLMILNYRQILKSNDTKLKINLISLLALNPVRENVNLIKEALNDDNEMVRILAANTLQRMEDYYVENISNLEKELKNNISDEKKGKIYFELAKFFDEYIYSTLVPDDIVDFYREKMFLCFEKAYNSIKLNPEYSEKYIRACIRFEKLEKAKELIDKHLSRYPNALGVKIWLCDYYLKTGNINEIYNILKSLPSDKMKKIPKIYKAYKWWLESEKQTA
jgi:hypothetical protein